jgi:hypothetical protein
MLNTQVNIKLFWLVMIVLLVGSIGMIQPSPLVAQDEYLGGSYASAVRIYNMGNVAANCRLVAYDADRGTEQWEGKIGPIAPCTAEMLHTPDQSDLASGDYAMSVYCDQEVKVVVNFSRDEDAPTKFGSKGDAFVGIKAQDAANSLFVPGVYNDYYDYYTTLRIQNLTDKEQTVQVSYYGDNNDQSVPHEERYIAPRGAVFVSQEGSELKSDTQYSANVQVTSATDIDESNQISVVSLIYGKDTEKYQLYAISAFKEEHGSTNIYIPLVMREYYNWKTATTIQNVGKVPTDVKITYTSKIDGKTYVRMCKDLEPRTSCEHNHEDKITPIDKNDQPTDDERLPSGEKGIFSAHIESVNGQPLIVTVNESRDHSRASSFEGVSSGSKVVVAPIVMKDIYGYNSSIECRAIGENPNPTIRNGKVFLAGKDEQLKKVAPITVDMPENGSLSLFDDINELQKGWMGAAIIKADNEIVCVINSDRDREPISSEDKDYLSAYIAVPSNSNTPCGN